MAAAVRYEVVQKRNGRWGVKHHGKWVTGQQKIDILVKEGKIKPAAKKVEEPAPEKAEGEATESGSDNEESN